MRKRLNLTGHQYGKLKVISMVEGDYTGSTKWNCECECGNKLVVSAAKLRNPAFPKKDCGCEKKPRVFEAIYRNINVDGTITEIQETADNQTMFARKYHLSSSCICNCLKGLQKSHKGWTFRYL